MDIKKLVEKIRTKKFRNLDENIIIEKINEFLRKNPKIKLEILNERSKEIDRILKYVKQRTYSTYGMFQGNISKRDKLFKKFIENPNEELKSEILKTHSSTRERLEFYDKLKKGLSEFIDFKNDTILDLGAGLNPLKFDESKITAIELNKDDADFLNEYFKIKNKRSIAISIDLRKDYEKLKEIKSDVVFAFKLFDVLGLRITEEIIKNLNAKILVASFSTKTLGNRRMERPRRIGFERILTKMNLTYSIITYENEMFYVIKLC